MIKVELVNWIQNPIETLFTTEKFAKTDSDNPYLVDIPLVAKIRRLVKTENVLPVFDPIAAEAFPHLKSLPDAEAWKAYVDEVESWAMKVATMSIPIAEQVSFNFRFSGVTIAWREQLVRHRTASYWVQGGRTTDFSTIFDRRAYHVPKSIQDAGLNMYVEGFWKQTQDMYKKLKAAGVKDEDAREIIGVGATHRLNMAIDLRSLMQMLMKRTCFIVQGHWVDVVIGIVNELVNKVDPLFGILGLPPCLDHNRKFTRCHFDGICQERHDGKDPLPVCPIWLGHVGAAHTKKTTEELQKLGRWDGERNKVFAGLWGKKDLDGKLL